MTEGVGSRSAKKMTNYDEEAIHKLPSVSVGGPLLSLGKIDQLRRRSHPFNQIFAQYNQDNTLYFCISLFLFWLSFIYLVILAVAAVGFAVLQIHFHTKTLSHKRKFVQKKLV